MSSDDSNPESRPQSDPRVTLTDLKETDVLTIRRWFLDSQPQAQTCRPIIPKTDEELIAGFHERNKKTTCRDFAIRRVSDNKLIGKITYFDLNTRNRSAEVGCLLDPAFRGQGFASEALGLLLTHLFGDLNLNKAMAQTGEFNSSAIAMLERWGFRQDGRLRQHHELDGVMHDDLVFSLLADDFKHK